MKKYIKILFKILGVIFLLFSILMILAMAVGMIQENEIILGGFKFWSICMASLAGATSLWMNVLEIFRTNDNEK